MVRTLTRPLVGKHHHIFMDNFFTSPALFMDLLQDGIYACGTVRTNRRGFPQDLKGKKNLKNRYAHLKQIHTTIHIYITPPFLQGGFYSSAVWPTDDNGLVGQ